MSKVPAKYVERFVVVDAFGKADVQMWTFRETEHTFTLVLKNGKAPSMLSYYKKRTDGMPKLWQLASGATADEAIDAYVGLAKDKAEDALARYENAMDLLKRANDLRNSRAETGALATK